MARKLDKALPEQRECANVEDCASKHIFSAQERTSYSIGCYGIFTVIDTGGGGVRSHRRTALRKQE